MQSESIGNTFTLGVIISSVSALASICSATIALRAYRMNSLQFNKNKILSFTKSNNEKLENVYLNLSNFIQNFTSSRETKLKRLERDRIIFSLESIRIELESSIFIDNSFNVIFGDISLLVSDLTYEKNFEKNMRDLAIIQNMISQFKSKLNSINEN